MSQPTILNLPPLPAGWDDLTWQQLIDVWTLYDRWQYQPTRFRFEVFCLLSGLRLIEGNDNAPDADGEDEEYHRFRRRGFWPWLRRERVSMRAWEIHSWVQDRLAWLDHPEGLSWLPRDIVVIRGRHYALPQGHLDNVTYEQYNNMQRIMRAYWSFADSLRKAMHDGECLVQDTTISREELTRRLVKISQRIETAQRGVEQNRARFLAHALVPAAWSLTETREGHTHICCRRTYTYDMERAEAQVMRMRRAPSALFHIANQLTQAALAFFKSQFPNLFTQSGSHITSRSEMVAQIGTLNQLKQRLNYPHHQDVNETPVAIVFEALDAAIKESEDNKRIMAKANARIPRKR